MAKQRVHYVHKMSYSAQERLVGLFVLGALALVIALVFINGKTASLFKDKVYYSAYLKNADGVNNDTRVRVSGIVVGSVDSVDITDDNRILMNFYVLDRYQYLIREDSRAALVKLSVVGASTLDIKSGSIDEPVMMPGSFIDVDEPLSVDELLTEITPVIENVRISIDALAKIVTEIDSKSVGVASQDLTQTLANLRKVSDQIASGKGLVGQTVFDRDFEAQTLASIEALNRTLAATEQRMSQLGPIMDNTKVVTDEARVLSKELPQLTEETQRLVAQMNIALSTVNVELQQFPDLITRMKLLMEESERVLSGAQRIWPLSSAVEVPTESTVVPIGAANE